MISGRVDLPGELFSRLEALARHALPQEAIAFLGGPGRAVIDMVLPVRNIASEGAFFADPFDQFQAERKLGKEDKVLVGIFHSHPGGGAALSARDVAFALRRPELLQLVMALDCPHCGQNDLRAYRVTDAGPIEVSIVNTEHFR